MQEAMAKSTIQFTVSTCFLLYLSMFLVVVVGWWYGVVADPEKYSPVRGRLRAEVVVDCGGDEGLGLGVQLLLYYYYCFFFALEWKYGWRIVPTYTHAHTPGLASVLCARFGGASGSRKSTAQGGSRFSLLPG